MGAYVDVIVGATVGGQGMSVDLGLKVAGGVIVGNQFLGVDDKVGVIVVCEDKVFREFAVVVGNTVTVGSLTINALAKEVGDDAIEEDEFSLCINGLFACSKNSV